MKQLIEVANEGLESLMGQRVTLFCLNYFYSGKLIGVNDKFVKLTDAGVVFETGPFDKKDWQDYQKLPNDVYVMTGMIESFTVLK